MNPAQSLLGPLYTLYVSALGQTVGIIFLSANIHHAIVGTVTGPVVYTAAQAFLLSKLIKDSLMIKLVKAAFEGP